MDQSRALALRIYAGIAALLIVCATVVVCVMPTERLEKLGHFLTDPATALAVASIGGAIVALHLRARATPVAMLLVALGTSTLSGCTPSQWSDAMHVIKPAGKWSCALANALCVKGSDDAACAVIASVCGIVEPLLDAVPETLPTSGGEDEPHDLSAEE